MAPDRIGQQLGNYRLVRLLGGGGFAQVYLGEHVRLHTQAAIKVLHTQIAASEVDSFLTEAQTIAHLEHPHIVRVLDFDVAEGIPFLVMSYAPNGTLRQRHPKGTQLPLPTIVSYVIQLADALQYAHNEKLIHRDVKPENMLVGRRNEVLLSDFGIALVAQSSRYQSTQDVIGTVAYMAPEQIQGKPRPASDQYSLAIVVYEWLCGNRPFHGSFTELCTQHMYATPAPLREKVPTLPVDVEQVVLTALAKEPRQRFASIRAFATELEQASQAAPEQVSTVLPQPSSQQHPPTASSIPSALIPTLPSPQGVSITQSSSAEPAQESRPELRTPTPETNRTPLPTISTPLSPVLSERSPQRRGPSWHKAALFIVLSLLIAGSAGLLYNTVNTSNAHILITTTALNATKAYESFIATNGVMFGFDAFHTHFNPYERVLSPSNVSALIPAWTYPTVGFISTSPAVVNGMVYFGSDDGSLYALDARTGTRLWSYSTRGAIESSPVVVNGVIYFGSNGSLYALDARTGTRLWWNFLVWNVDVIKSSPAVVNGEVYLGFYSAYSLFALDARTGNGHWNFSAGGMSTSSPAVVNGVVYAGSDDGSLFALDARTGTKLWNFSAGSWIRSSSAVANGAIYFGSNMGFYALDARTGTKLWSYSTVGAVSSSPVVANGVVYFGSWDHSLYALDARTGTKLWSYSAGAAIDYSSPTVANGMVYIGSDDGKLYAFHLQ